jgi:hypothetical protein
MEKDKQATANAFAAEANQKRTSSTGELVDFLRTSKKWWLTPIVVMMVLLGVLVVLSGTGAAPFIYTLF